MDLNKENQTKKEQERWRIIPDYNGRYSISTEGNIKRNEWVITAVRDGEEHIRILSETAIKPYPTGKQGHLMVKLTDEGGKQQQHYVHRLVMDTFRGDPVVVHLDNDPSNNNLSNLRYRSQRENIIQSVEEGRHSGLMTSVDHVVAEFNRMINRKSKEEEIMDKLLDELFEDLKERGIGVGVYD